MPVRNITLKIIPAKAGFHKHYVVFGIFLYTVISLANKDVIVLPFQP